MKLEVLVTYFTIFMANSKNKTVSISRHNNLKYYLIMVSIPVIFFVLLELALRIAGYGHNYDTFISSGDYNKEMIYQNPEIAFKYFDNIEYSNILPDGFYKAKKEGAFRIFVLGESSAAGFPYNSNCSFPSHLKRKLELLFPGKDFEVINLGASAINSYTMADIIPDVLEQKPDLILIYAGHNEYYGALGAASSSRIASGRWFVNMMLGLREYKTTELLRNLVKSVKSIFTTERENVRETVAVDGFRIKTSNLMEAMVQDAFIPFDSDTYKEGITQFEENITVILDKAREAQVPVIIGTLTSNLRDQRPFVADNPKQYNLAVTKYKEAVKALESNDSIRAKKLFTEAKELDGVRFRAPEAINMTIRKLASEYKIPLVDIDSAFSEHSQYKITGNSLICDHLHPNYYGYRLMADEFLKVILKSDVIKIQDYPPDITGIESLYNDRFPLTEYDSLYSEIIIKVLTGSYPYVAKGLPNNNLKTIKITNYLDSAVMMYRTGARPTIAAWHLEQNRVRKFIDEMYNLVASAPFDEKPYNTTIKILQASGLYKTALPFIYEVLSKSRQNESIVKWKKEIGNDINNMGKTAKNEIPIPKTNESKSHYLTAKAKLTENNPEGALAELEAAIRLNESFYQAINDKALLVIRLRNDRDEALKLFNKALEIKPDFEESLLNRSYLFYLQKKYKEALQDIQSALSRNQTNGRLYYTRGLIYYETGKQKLACNDWKTALQLGFDAAVTQLAEKCN